jgi:proline dehydrogenase
VTRLVERLLYKVAKRWIAGYTLDDAIRSAHDANERKIKAILNRLGEHTPNLTLIQGYVEEYLRLLDRISAEKIDGTISVKPSQIGLAASISLYRENLLKILERAREEDMFVWLDMENSPYTEATVQVYRELLPDHRKLGMCIQANMRRSETDVEDLLTRGGRIRLVKGAYPENGEVAFKKRSEVDANYARIMRMLFEQGDWFAIATHDGKMIGLAKSLSREDKTRFEFQLLKGIRDDLKTSLLTDGYNVSEYIPYGPEWYNYSKRRMRERKRNILLLIRSITG